MTSQHLGFRDWKKEDLPLATELWSDPAVTEMIGGPFTEDVIQARLAQEIEQGRQCQVQYWPLFLLEDHQHVGCAGLRPYRQEPHVYEFGIHLRREFWGKGLAAEAARRVIEFGFNVIGAEALFAGHHPENLASRRLLEKLGFVYTHDELYAPTGLIHPSYLLRRTVTTPSAPPPIGEPSIKRNLGKFRGDGTIVGDIVGPIVDSTDWGDLAWTPTL